MEQENNLHTRIQFGDERKEKDLKRTRQLRGVGEVIQSLSNLTCLYSLCSKSEGSLSLGRSPAGLESEDVALQVYPVSPDGVQRPSGLVLWMMLVSEDQLAWEDLQVSHVDDPTPVVYVLDSEDVAVCSAGYVA